MARKKKEEEVKAGSPEWMSTYGDLVTLLMCFFVLLFAMSNVDANKFQSLASGVQGNPISLTTNSGASEGIMDFLGNGIMEMPDMKTSTAETNEDFQDAKNEMSEMASDFKTYLAENNIPESSVDIQEGDQSLKIVFGDAIMFDSGSADLKPESLSMLDIIADQLLKYPDNTLSIEGHTDTAPIRTVEFPNNLRLSSARSISVVLYLMDKGILPNRLEAIGFGEFRPIAPNDTPENMAKNRRVEINIVSKYYSDTY